MLTAINKYVLNFFLWWYLIQSKTFLSKVFGFWFFALSVLNVVPMLENLFQPLYQDYTRMGRIIAFPIRFTWVFMGSLALLLLIIPIFLIASFYLILPILPVFGILGFLFEL